MKSTELRIGNYVYPDMSYPEPIKVIAKDFENTSYLQPIPLTEEWLLELGFGYWEDVDEWYSPDDSATLRINHYTKGDKIGFYEGDYGVQLKHVHQLQNLFFALCGEELKLKQ